MPQAVQTISMYMDLFHSEKHCLQAVSCNQLPERDLPSLNITENYISICAFNWSKLLGSVPTPRVRAAGAWQVQCSCSPDVVLRASAACPAACEPRLMTKPVVRHHRLPCGREDQLHCCHWTSSRRGSLHGCGEADTPELH